MKEVCSRMNEPAVKVKIGQAPDRHPGPGSVPKGMHPGTASLRGESPGSSASPGNSAREARQAERRR